MIKLFGSACLLSGALLSSGASAQEADGGIQDIVVTATRTGETALQKTPLAVTVFSAADLSGSQVNNVKDLVALTPGLNVSQVTASAQIYIRGIGSSNVNNGSDPDVTVQVDGVYLARAFAQFSDFIDVERVEVLRGPQGTLYGRNAVGGTINVLSRKPSDQFQAKAILTGGTFDLLQGQAYVSGPLVPGKLQASITGNYIRQDDFIDNISGSGPSGVGNANRGGLRGQLRFTPTDDLELITRADWSKAGERFDSFDHLLAPIAFAPIASGTVGDYTKVSINERQKLHSRFWGVSEEINLGLTDQLSLKSLTAYRDSRYDLVNDTDATEVAVNRGYFDDRSKQFSQEFNLGITAENFKGVLGVYYFRERQASVYGGIVAPSIVTPAANSLLNEVAPRVRTVSKAVFAQGTYKITDDLSATFGLRYTQDEKTFDQYYTRTSLNPANLGASFPGFPFIVNNLKQKFDAFTPKFGVDYQITPTAMIYASATRGFKSGGVNSTSNNPLTLTFAPESIWSYEGGIKSDWFDRRLRVNITAFKYDYKDLQVQSLVSAGVLAINNAASASVKGLEIETVARPVSNLTLSANYALLDAEYRRFSNASVPNALVPFLANDPRFRPAVPGVRPATYEASGNRLNAAPKSSISASAQFDQDLAGGTAFIRGEYYWQSRVHYDPSNAAILSQRPYDLVNLSAGFNNEDAGWSARIIAKNVTQTRYLIAISGSGIVPAGLAGAPRTVALQLSTTW